jgi:hypothetical protein
MRKRIVPAISVRSALHGEWLNLEGLAEIEVTSEDPAYPVEGALLPGGGEGWRAGEPGKQTLRILFDNPQKLTMISLVFVEEKHARTQEFVLRWAESAREPLKEIVRQQYHFTPVASEVENYAVDLSSVKVLELEIVPSISGGGLAILTELRLR